MRILIADDEAPARERLRGLLERLTGHTLCGEAHSGLEALRLATKFHPEVVLLDIQMPDGDGLEIARQLAALPQPPAVIFTTAYSEYALEAFDAQVSGYLLKPIRLERLEQALQRVAQVNRAQLLHLAAQPPETEAGRTHIYARLGQQVRAIPLSDVFFFQADQKYVRVRHRQGETLIETSLKALEEDLGNRVLRVHRNALAMATQIAGLVKETDEGGCSILFHGIDDRLEVSRRHLSDVRQFLRQS